MMKPAHNDDGRTQRIAEMRARTEALQAYTRQLRASRRAVQRATFILSRTLATASGAK